MSKGVIALSMGELDRLSVIEAIVDKRLRHCQAARQLGLSVRQVKRLLRAYRESGPDGLVSGHRGKTPGNARSLSVRQAVLSVVRERYRDFGPTLASEKLLELHGASISRETLRRWMIADGLWQPKSRRKARIHPRRPRRPCFGELVQIDGSPHDWFEGRAEPCTLIVFIDDATSRLLALRFVRAETTQAYLETLAQYLQQQGRPVALYSDQHSIFRVNHPQREGERTQFSRALKTLDIQAIHAHTPQAKGRVERANQTLQDRLVKEMRLQGLCDRETANACLPAFIETYNQRFAVAPQSAHDAHRPVLHTPSELALILCPQHIRTLSKNLTCQFQNREYQIQTEGPGYTLRKAKVTVCEAFDQTVTLLYQGRSLPYRILQQGEPPTPLADEKSVADVVTQAKANQKRRSQWKPAPDHPWRRYPVTNGTHAR